MSDARTNPSPPPDLEPPSGAVSLATSGRAPRDADELEGAAQARADRVEAAGRRDLELARSGGGAGDDIPGASDDTLEEGDGRPSQTLLEHLEELRVRLLKSVIAILVGAAAGWYFSAQALEFTIRRTVGHVTVLDPIEAFSERFKLALVMGACVALPVVLYQAWSFVLPGLFRRERRLLLPLVGASLLLFFAGAATAILLVVPIVLEVLRTFLTPSMQQNIRLSSLLGFIYNLALATGVVFQLPLVAGALAALGIVTSGALLRQWRIAIVATLVVSALITPGDVVTAQIVLGLPLVVLYMLSVLVAWIVERARRTREREQEAA